MKCDRSQDQSQRNAVFQTAKPASLAVTGSKGKMSVPDKFYDHSNHVRIW